MRVGIPRALMYFWYGTAWESFVRACGHTPVTSSPTGKRQMELGVRSAQDEVCLPVKVFLGHIRELVEYEKVDAVWIPHLIQVESGCYICPKFMGLPDMVRTMLPKGFPLWIWQNNHIHHAWSMGSVPSELQKTVSRRTIESALKEAQLSFDEHWRMLAALNGKDRNQGDYAVGLIAHPYCLYDDGLNLGLRLRLRDVGVRLLMPEAVPENYLNAPMAGLNKPLFWTLGRRALGAALYYADQGVNGVVHLSAFACGPESIVGEIIERRLHERGITLLQMNLDEHTGEAGMATRLEAFLDMLARRKNSCG